MAIFQPRTFNEILGEMISRLISVTPITDVNLGSVAVTLLEAAAQEDDEQYFQMLQIIRNFAIDTTSGDDLDRRASEFSITRFPSRNASTRVTISDTAFTKVETNVYSGLPGAAAGQLTINGNSSTGFTVSGSIIVGRGTTNVETIPYSSITNFGNYVTFNLTTPFAFDHGTDESIILSQGGIRSVPGGVIVFVPASDLNEQIDFILDFATTILDGEHQTTNISVSAVEPGSVANVPIGAINQFASPPFSTAQVNNPSRVTNGKDIETDQELRDRIKATIQSLSRGTRSAITTGIIGLLSEEENKRVVSASIIEPTLPSEVVKVFIDDGTGFIPTSSHIGSEEVVGSATGGERFLRIDNVPLVKASAETQNVEPFNLNGLEILVVEVNGVVESITFVSTDFENPGSATAEEIIERINTSAGLYEGRKTSDNRVRIFARSNPDDRIRVTGGTANAFLNFPTDPKESAKLYLLRDNALTLLNKDGITASVESGNAENYNFSGSQRLLVLVVDGDVLNPQLVFFDPSDFTAPAGATAEEVVERISEATGAIADVSSVGTRVRIASLKQRSAQSKVRVVETFSKVWKVASLVFSDATVAAASSGSNIQLFQNNGDSIYVGHDDVAFQSIAIANAIAASGSIDPIFRYYSSIASAFVPFGVHDGTIGFTVDGILTFRAPHDWAKTVVNGGAARYYIQIERSAVVLATPPTESVVKIGNANLILGFSETEVLGANKDYTLNRFIGQIELVSPLLAGDQVTLGSLLTRAFAVNGTDAPFALFGGESLNFNIDGVPTVVNFVVADFGIPGLATAFEVVTKINSVTNGASASVLNGTRVRLQTNTWNEFTGTIQVTGGTANALLAFSTTIKTTVVPHVPAVESVAGAYLFTAGMNIVVIVDDLATNTFVVPTGKVGTLTSSVDTSNVKDSGLSAIFPNATDIVGYDLLLTSGPASGQRRTISTYNPVDGNMAVTAPYGFLPGGTDTYEIIPVSAFQVVKLWNNKQVTLVSTKTEVKTSFGGTKVQLASLNSSENAAIQVTGGPGNSILLFQTSIKRGVDAYRHFTGLLQFVQNTIDGKIDDPENFPAIKAAGVQVEVGEPISISLDIELDISTREGVTLTSVTNDIKSAVTSYVNNLPVGGDVVIAEIITAIKNNVTSVFDVSVLSPTENESVADNKLVRISESNILVG